MFADHHAYTHVDVRTLRAEAKSFGAEVLVTTEKDWVKLENISSMREPGLPIVHADVEIRFRGGDDEARLLQAIRAATGVA